jgi:glyceraldehyde 3-phosphate dehydrogenase (phosphorylating)
MKVAINGFGRIGRTVFRLLQEREGVEVVGINDITNNEALAYLLRHDTVMGNFPGKAVIEGDKLVTDSGSVKMTAIRNPNELPWKELGVDFTVEATGIFRTREQCAMHLEAGARKVILTVPSKDEIDATIVLGVNNEDLKPEHQIVSHAYTNDQKLIDAPHSDFRRARAAAENIIPTTTGAARAVGMVLPQLKGKMDGMAMRVPVPCGSVVDLVTTMKKSVTVEEVNAALKAASESDRLKGILSYNDDYVVSADIVGDAHSSIFDPGCTSVINGNLLKTVSWYDNEWGYSNRVCDLLTLMETVG